MMAMPSSISAFAYVLKSPAVLALVSGHLNPVLISTVVSVIEITKWISLTIALVVIFLKTSVMRDVEIFALLIVLISNFGVWLFGGMYSMNAAGLINCYIMAIPFNKFSWLGDLFFVALLFGIYEFVSNKYFTNGRI